MTYRVARRRFYWRWYGELELAGGPTLRLSGDAVRWLRPGDEVELVAAGAKTPDLLDGSSFALARSGRPVWPPFASELEHQRAGVGGAPLYAYRLRLREAAYEEDFEAIAALERAHAGDAARPAALWRCPDGSEVWADEKPRCQSGYGRLRQLRGSSAASRFLLLELAERDPTEPAAVGYLRLDPPLAAMSRRAGEGGGRVRERAFPASWFAPTFDPKALQPAGRPCEEAVQAALDGLAPAAARISRVVIHPDYRSDGLGTLLVRGGLRWVTGRAVPDGRRDKELVCSLAPAARYHPFLEKAGFRYLWEVASGRPLLAYPLSDAAAGRLRRFLQNDPAAREHQGRLFKTRLPRAAGLSGPVIFRDVLKRRTAGAGVAAFGVREGAERLVLPRTALRFQPGGVYLLWGANQAGVQALLRLVWDEMPDEGWVDTPPGRVAAYIPGVAWPQADGETVMAGLTARLGDEAAAFELLGRLGLADPLAWLGEPELLSAAQRERYRLALLLAGRPDLLLVGELAAHQSPAGARFLARALSLLARQSGVTLIASSSRPEVRRSLEPDGVVHVGYEAVWRERWR